MVREMRIATFFLAFALVAGLPAAVLAADAAARPQYAVVLGTLSGKGSGTIAVTTPDAGVATIPVGSHTHYVARSRAAARAGLVSGDQVAVNTMTTSTGTIATSVQYDVKPFGVPLSVTGTTTSVAAGSLTLSTGSSASLAVKITDKTRYTLDGRGLKSVAAIPANEPARVSGTRMTTGEFDARLIALGPPSGRILVRGSIATSGLGTLGVTTQANRTLQVTITSGTLYVVDRTLVASAPSITSGQKVDVIATRGTGGVLTASSIWVKTH
jgi:hypothetical protein